MLKVIVDEGCSHRPQFSRVVWGHAPPRIFFNFEPSESGSEAFCDSFEVLIAVADS